MESVVKKDILAILEDIKKILETSSPDVAELKAVSNRTIHNSSIFQDEDSVSIAILSYSLSKIIDRKGGSLNLKPFRIIISEALACLDKDDVVHYRDYIKKCFRLIQSTDSRLRQYIRELISQSQIKKAGKIYAHGISSGRAAEILGISQWELLEYVGKTVSPEVEDESINISKRLRFTRGLFS